MVKRSFLVFSVLLFTAAVIPISGVSALGLDQLSRPSTTTSVIGEAPILDGIVIDDPAWAGVPPTSGFIQQNPDPGQPASQKTEVFIASTSDTPHIDVVCNDSDPDQIIVANLRFTWLRTAIPNRSVTVNRIIEIEED